MQPLRLCFVWHFHQPDYRYEDRFVLPWVRLHAAKDYVWLPRLFEQYRHMRCTFNVVPSLIDQLTEVAQGKPDELQNMAHLDFGGLDERTKGIYSRMLGVLVSETQIRIHPRLQELVEGARNEAWRRWVVQDWMDAIVWYNMAWCSPLMMRSNDVLRALHKKARNFTREDLHTVLDAHVECSGQVTSTLRELMENGRIEVSTSPYHHPILPLLADTDCAREALPYIMLPEHSFQFPHDAYMQMSTGISHTEQWLGHRPTSMWPSEGSLSATVLKMMGDSGIGCTATDQRLLRNLLRDAWWDAAGYHAWKAGDDGPAVLFRDTELSDVIGFEYTSWNAEDAASDFIHRLELRRDRIVHHHGEEGLSSAVVPIILDGENCWEFYESNGEDFLHALCRKLGDTERYQLVTMSEAATQPITSFNPDHMVAGSWINGNFDIWIGNDAKNRGWTALREAREAFEHTSQDDLGDKYDEVLNAMMSAESSDWFWWYDEHHRSANNDEFDMLFRARLRVVFEACNAQCSYDLQQPLGHHAHPSVPHNPDRSSAMHRSSPG